MKPDDPTVNDILRRSRCARIATTSVNGRPNVNPLYFVRWNGRVHLGTTTGTLAARNVRAHPQVAILFNAEPNPGDKRVLRMYGAARIRTDRPTVTRYLLADMRKYVLTVGGLRNMVDHIGQLPLLGSYVTQDDESQSCVIEVTPQRVELLSAP